MDHRALVLLSALLAPPAAAHRPAADVHAAFDALTPRELDRFHVAQATWIAAGDEIGVEYAYLLGSREGFATYNPDGTLVTGGLTEIPTSWLLRIPEGWNGRLVVIIPGGTADHTQLPGNAARMVELGFAVATLNYPSPGFPGFPWDRFSQRPREIPAHYDACIRFVKRFIERGFGPIATTLFYGASRGVGRGGGMLVGIHDNPIDGYVLVAAGDGRKGRLSDTLEVLRSAAAGGPNVIKLTGEPTAYPLPLDDVTVADLASQIGFADPDYRSFVLDGADDAEMQARILAYDITARPRRVQRDWDDTVFDGDLQAKVMVLHGTDDNDTWASGPVDFVQSVVDAGRAGRVRLYIVDGQPHGPWPDAGIVDALLAMDDWVERGAPPGTLVLGLGALAVENDHQLGYATNPLQYFLCELAGDCR